MYHNLNFKFSIIFIFSPIYFAACKHNILIILLIIIFITFIALPISIPMFYILNLKQSVFL